MWYGIKIVDISNPLQPVMVGTIGNTDESRWAWEVEVYGDYLYFIDMNQGIEIYNIKNPITPEYIDNINISGRPFDITFYGNYAYISLETAGVQIFDICKYRYEFLVTLNSNISRVDIIQKLYNILPDNVDSIGICYSYIKSPDSIRASNSELVGVFSVSDTIISVAFEVHQDSIYTFGVFYQDGNGRWQDSLSVTTIGKMIYDYSNDSLIMHTLFVQNDFGDLSLSDIADTSCGRVCILDISNNGIKTLCGDIGGFKQLEQLYINDNALITLPEQITGLSDLNVLDLSGNYLSLYGIVKNWALRYDPSYQLHQKNLTRQLYINDKNHAIFRNGYILKSVLVVEPKGSYTEHSLFLSYDDNYEENGWWSSLLEINHLFELPESAIVTDLWLWMEDSVMQARMYDITTAEDIYDSIVSAPMRIDPAILKKDGDHYELNVYPYSSDDVARVKITYITPTDINGDTAISHAPIPMLDLNNYFVKPLTILFKENADVAGRTPFIVESTAVVFEHNKDTLGYRYREAHIDDITYFPELSIAYRMDSLDSDPATDALMQANANINYLFTQEPVDTSAIIDSSIYYNILTDFTALLVLEPDATNHFMVAPLDEGNFVDPIDDPQITGISDVFGLLEMIGFKIDPHPFSTHTNIIFILKQEAFVRFEVFSPMGALLKNVYAGDLSAGQQRLPWDGRTDTGASLETGTYIYRIEVDGRVECGKVMKF